jgi:23S rRNA (uridine2552-2'-O)-methyltransferase
MDMVEIPGTIFIKGDITDAQVLNMVRQSFPNGIDVLLSDMAHSFSGFASVDVPKVHSLVEFALQVGSLPGMMKPNSRFVAKYLNGAGLEELKELIESRFEKTYCYKPKACRAESREAYIIGMGFKL